jgi:phage terminase large subunit GpA-like protein
MGVEFDKLEKGQTRRGDRVTSSEYSRIRKAEAAKPKMKEHISVALLSRLKASGDIINDWEDWTPTGFKWWASTVRILKPPPDLTVDLWADKYRKIPAEFAAEPGDWSTSRVSCMREPMKACSPSDPCRRVVMVKPVQAGGTEALILNVAGHTIDINPRSMLITFPTIDLAESFSRERLEPMIKMIPRLSDRVLDVGGRNPDRSTVKKKRYPGGFLNLTGANSTSGLSSRAVPIVMMDETDECIRNAGTAGDPTKLLSARTTTFPDKKEIFLSSPSNEIEETGILQMWEDSSQGWLETQCPNKSCKHWQVLEFERMDLETATLSCAKCGQYFKQWQWNGRGEEFERWTHHNPEHRITKGFRLSGLNSPWLDWQIDIVDEYKEADRILKMGDDSLMRVFVNTKLAKAFKMRGKKVEADLYNDRREVYECHSLGTEIPDGVILLTAAVDVQDTALVYDIIGWGKSRESWAIETGEFQGDPHLLPDPRYPGRSVWDKIDDYVYSRVLRYADGKATKLRLIFVDSGGHCTTEVYKYCKPRQPRVFAIKGVGGVGYPMIIGGKNKERNMGTWLLRLGVDTLKDEFHSRLAIDRPGPGYCHFPMHENGQDAAGYNQDYFDQLVAEQRILKYTTGGFARYEWHKNRTDANEAMDLRCYSRAALEYLKVRLEQIPRDVLANFNSDQISKIETGLGRSILVDKNRKGTLRHEHGRATQRINTTSTMGGEGFDQGDTGEIKRSTVRTRVYGAAGTSF